MLPELYLPLCVRPDVAAVRYPGQNLRDNAFRTLENSEQVEGVLKLAEVRAARYVVFDIRNVAVLTDRLVAISVKLWKELKGSGCRLVLLCSQDYRELMAYIKIDRVFPILCDEADLQKFLDADEADVPIYVTRTCS